MSLDIQYPYIYIHGINGGHEIDPTAGFNLNCTKKKKGRKKTIPRKTNHSLYRVKISFL